MPEVYPVDMSKTTPIKAFFNAPTNTVSYVVSDPESGACAIYDSVLDFDYNAGRIDYKSANEIIEYIKIQGLKVEWLIETHAHADHLSAAPYIQNELGGKTGIGEQITQVQEIFGKVFNAGTEFERDGSQFDKLFKDGDTYMIGDMAAFCIHTPGHTPACMVHVVGDAAFVGDTLFMPDAGTARADFPGGDAGELYHSIKKVLRLPKEMRLFMCHDYGPNGRDIAWETTVEEQRAQNIHVKDGINEGDFVRMRTTRDETLRVPELIIPSVQVNMRAGKMPKPEDDGKRYLKIPLDVL